MNETPPYRIKKLLRITGRSNAKFAIIPDELFNKGMEYVVERNCAFGSTLGREGHHDLLAGHTRIISVSRAEKNMEKYYKVMRLFS